MAAAAEAVAAADPLTVPRGQLLRVGIFLGLVLAAVGCSSAQDGEPAAGQLTVAREVDGDSFVASDGVEYRVGMINTPELSACGGHGAADRAYELLDGGFSAEPYADDPHGRQVARIATDDGDLGVILAAEGLADDRYLQQHRHEHPGYAAELDEAFADARREGSGLWASCWVDQPVQAPRSAAGQPVEHVGRTDRWSCHPAYVECLPDGPDLDCAEVGHQVQLVGQDDPFRLDGNSTTATDGTGCDTFPVFDPDAGYPYHR